MLKIGGRIWVEVPFLFPHHPAPEDYWRVILSGLRIWMREFTEIDAGFFRIAGSRLHVGVFFHGYA